MTTALSGKEVAGKIEEKLPGSVVEATSGYVLVDQASLLKVAEFLKESADFSLDFLSFVTAVDYYDYFEVVFHLMSLERNHGIVLKARCHERENPSLPSVTGLWQGANFQEREIYDLMGIRFEGHPNMKRIVLWEGFQGHPLRKDYLQ